MKTYRCILVAIGLGATACGGGQAGDLFGASNRDATCTDCANVEDAAFPRSADAGGALDGTVVGSRDAQAGADGPVSERDAAVDGHDPTGDAADPCPTSPAFIDCSRDCDKTGSACSFVNCNSSLRGNTNDNYTVPGRTDVIVRTPSNPYNQECADSCKGWPPAPTVLPVYGIDLRFSGSPRGLVEA